VLTRQEKEEQVAELRDRLARATSVFVADYRGLSVPAANELRSKLRSDADECEYRVAKNSLLRLAVAETELSVLNEHFVGPTAVAIGYGDPVGVAKVLVDYQKDHQVFELKGGYLDGKPLDEAGIKTLSTMPTLDEARAKLVGLLNAPATKLVRLLGEPGGQLARLVAARRDSLEA